RSFSSLSLSFSERTCPMPKPISTFFSASAISMLLRGFDDLGQHAVGGARVQEGDAAAADAGPRLGVDQLDTARLELVQAAVDVLNPVGDVVQAGSLAGEELADRGALGERAQELDVAGPDVEQDSLDPLFLDGLAVRHRHAERLAVQRDRAVE